MAIPEITPREAQLRLTQGAVLVDVREDHERELGMAEGARGIARAELEEDPSFHFADTDAELVLICQSGGRSMLAAEVLQRLGYRNVVSVRGPTPAPRSTRISTTAIRGTCCCRRSGLAASGGWNLRAC